MPESRTSTTTTFSSPGWVCWVSSRVRRRSRDIRFRVATVTLDMVYVCVYVCTIVCVVGVVLYGITVCRYGGFFFGKG